MDMRERARQLVSQMTADEKLGLLSTHQLSIERLGLGEFYIGTEVARGYVGRSQDHASTVFPQPVGLAATFDKELMGQLGSIAADEARAYYNQEKKGGLCLWGPTVDMVRDPLWGRTEEAYGEDPVLAGELTAAYTLSMQGDNGEFVKTVPTLKHFCANNNEANRGSCDAYLPLRAKYEYYYKVFEYGIRYGGARSVMAAYNEINGIPAIMNEELGTMLRDQWGMWFAVSDGGDFSQNVTAHRWCESYSQAYELSLNAGCDIMTDGEDLVRAAAKKALEQGIITWEEIDRSIQRTIYARLRLGQLDNCPYDSISKEVIDCQAHREVNRRAACEQVVLLKNNGVLPFKSAPEKLAVLGPLADDCLMDWYTGYTTYENTVLDGIRSRYPDSSIVYDSLWDIIAVKAPNGKYLSAKETGEVIADAEIITDAEKFELRDWGENWVNLFSVKYQRYLRLFDDDTLKLHNKRIFDWFTRETFNLFEFSGKTLVEEFLTHRRLTCDENGALTVKKDTSAGESFLWQLETLSKGSDRAAAIAEDCDRVIYCVGNYPTQVAKECYDRKTLALNIQQGMTAHLCAHNPHTVALIVSSYPYSIVEEDQCAAAVLWSSHAGAELGTAAASVLSGDYSPAGRLPLTWYRSERQLPDIMNYDIEGAGLTYLYFKGEPLYPFGYGLSYADFEYVRGEFSEQERSVSARITVKNTSQVSAEEVVQIYFTVKNSAVSRPERKLCAFERVFIQAGEEKTLTLTIPKHAMEIYDVRSGKMLFEGGTYTFMTGASSRDIRLENDLAMAGEAIGERGRVIPAITFEDSKNIRIGYAKGLKQNVICPTSWSGRAVYRGVPLAGAKSLRVIACSMSGVRKLAVKAGDAQLEFTLEASDGFDDYKSYTLPLPENISGSTIELTLPENTNLFQLVLGRTARSAPI